MTDLATRHRTACAIAEEAGALAKRLFHGRVAGRFELKGAQDYLTEADIEVERLVKSRLAEAFPGEAVFGEEGGGSFGERCWVIDPIDGTANFARGIPHFCVSIAYVEGKRSRVGAIHAPLAGELFSAWEGGGAWLNGARLAVSATTDVKRATLELGWSTRLPYTTYLAMVERAFAAGAGFTRAGSGALGLAYVAAGRIDGYAELHINSWDAAAALVMVTEAGGWTNDFLGGDGLRSGNPVLASTPALKDALQGIAGITG